jgi:hypothetical protein
MAVTVCFSSCNSGSTTLRTDAPTSEQTTTAEPPSAATSAVIVPDSIPFVNGAADSGCVDQQGTRKARAIDWYPGRTGGALGPNGDRVDVAAIDAFQRSAQASVAAAVNGFGRSSGFEFRRTAGGCVTHRYAIFDRGEDEVIVSAWRSESAADPFWIPNEATFAAVDDQTLVSDGPHISVVLLVAPDGTTVRVSSYGPHGRDLVAGWPSTITLDPSRQPGNSPYQSKDLVPIAQAVMKDVVGQRTK